MCIIYLIFSVCILSSKNGLYNQLTILPDNQSERYFICVGVCGCKMKRMPEFVCEVLLFKTAPSVAPYVVCFNKLVFKTRSAEVYYAKNTSVAALISIKYVNSKLFLRNF